MVLKVIFLNVDSAMCKLHMPCNNGIISCGNLTHSRSTVSTREDGTQAEVGIVFNRTTPAAQLPQNKVVAETLIEAVNNPNNTFNVSINPETVTTLGK